VFVDTALQIRRSLVRFQMVLLDFSVDINPSDRTMAMGSNQALTEMSTRSIFWVKRRPVCKADKLTTILCRCQEIWEP
jgi:hypothetical protein